MLLKAQRGCGRSTEISDTSLHFLLPRLECTGVCLPRGGGGAGRPGGAAPPAPRAAPRSSRQQKECRTECKKIYLLSTL